MRNLFTSENIIRNVFFILLGMMCLISCQKSNNTELVTNGPSVIIEGTVTDQPGPYTIKLSHTTDSLNGNYHEPITGAQVKINDDLGNYENLKESAPGVYITSRLKGIPGRTYILTVISHDKIYKAISTMPVAVSIDGLTIQGSGSQNNKELEVYFSDPAEILNYYRIVEAINGNQLNNFYVTDDRLLDGNSIVYTLSSGHNNKLKSGDKVTVFLESVDKSAYEYFKGTANSVMKPNLNDSPTNISNGAFGYFNACATRSKTIVVP